MNADLPRREAPHKLLTARLRLRAWREDDLDALAAVLGDGEVVRYVYGEPKTREGSEEVLGRRLEHWERYGFGFWAVETRGDGSFAGWLGLQYALWLPQLADEVEIGWLLDRAQQGKGFATEGARATLCVAFEELGLDRVFAMHHPDNVRSRRVMDKLGLSYVRDTVAPSDGSPVSVRVISREDWDRRRECRRAHRLEYAQNDE